MDQPLRRNARLLFTVLFISQVCGTPIFWSQPDCYQNQFSDVQYDTYESYQGPSYQDTLKSMVDETLRAINEIVQITVQVTKQEIASLSNVFQNPPNVNCNDSGESAVAPEDFQFTAPQQPVKFPGDSMDNSYPLYENPPVAELPHPTADNKNSSGTTQSSNVLDNKVGTDSNSSSQPSTQPENVTSHKNSSSTAQSSAVLDDKVGTDGSSSTPTKHTFNPARERHKS
ncbi:hypothetical protein J6590_093701 [Homalodisca vitripennis]|nr:hypothetical protein J6590_054835 [Homalodisca vitripennis]KAG8289961.1 hypothetical protein J6590_093701 [Homalodisca vitripennis]